ncbi:hypothetical protein JZ751_023369 [Albula glossodonta]|uniref:Uncharacterized protein n=1 Tax=Albula glossodonta TaxID=121402 RepID=A0A8T2NQ41_9TELE|nr:hypothetical protein JZ751_023369 [Albula glossodonta]
MDLGHHLTSPKAVLRLATTTVESAKINEGRSEGVREPAARHSLPDSLAPAPPQPHSGSQGDSGLPTQSCAAFPSIALSADCSTAMSKEHTSIPSSRHRELAQIADTVRGLCLVLLSLHLSVGDVPGPCRYSVRKDHLDTVRRLSNTCYVKAALPQILELINTHFRYSRSSDNGRYVEEVKALIHNMYSQNCIPPIDEELEDDPTKFNKVYRESPREALERVKEVFSLYLELMSTSNTPVDWNCDEEYAENELGSSTPLAQTTGATECRCFNPTVDYGVSEQVSVTDSLWNHLTQTPTPPLFPGSSARAQIFSGATDPMDGNEKMQVKDSGVTSGTKEGQESMDGVFVTSSFLRVGPPFEGRSAFSLKTEAFAMVTVSPLLGAESDIPVPTDNTPFPDLLEGREDLPVDTTDLGNDGSTSTTVSDFSRASLKNTQGMPGFTSDFLVDQKSSREQSASLQEFMGHPPSLVPLWGLEDQVEGTPKRPQASVAVPLAKRSLDSKQDGSYFGLLSNTPSPQREIATNLQQLPSISMELAMDKGELITASDHSSNLELTSGTVASSYDPKLGDVITTGDPGISSRIAHGLLVPTINQSPFPDLQSVEDGVASPDPLGHDSGKPYQSGNPEMWHNSNALAFIMAPVCGGLLLIPAFYCLRRQKKLQDLLKRFQTIENQRLNSLSTDVEMQDCETAVQACLSSQYSGELQNQDFHR